MGFSNFLQEKKYVIWRFNKIFKNIDIIYVNCRNLVGFLFVLGSLYVGIVYLFALYYSYKYRFWDQIVLVRILILSCISGLYWGGFLSFSIRVWKEENNLDCIGRVWSFQFGVGYIGVVYQQLFFIVVVVMRVFSKFEMRVEVLNQSRILLKYWWILMVIIKILIIWRGIMREIVFECKCRRKENQ